MSDDIVDRLRRWGDTIGSLGMMQQLHYEAANEIARLRAVLDALDFYDCYQPWRTN